MGKSIVLTSGVRGVVKQMYLFLAKAVRSDGNLSMASRSLAPPGHSFHGNGDFDVGKVGYGYRNFTEDFAKTAEFKRLEELGYIRIRYHEKNPFGVRFEPWHIKVVS
jgi:LAS superfamily LD-carboxypeptidase LdcB